MKKKTISGWLAVITLALLPLAWPGQSRADTTLFPLVVGYNATYAATVGISNFTASMQITEVETIGTTQWWTLQLITWEGPGTDPIPIKINSTADALYFYDPDTSSAKLRVSISNLGTEWTDNYDSLCMTTYLPSFGTFSDVYQIIRDYKATEEGLKEYEYWVAGVGLIYEEVPNWHDQKVLGTKTMTAYATPLPGSLLLLGSGLVGLLGFRRFRRS